MIKEITQYIIICDNPFCDSTMKTSVEHHSRKNREDFIRRVDLRGWGGVKEDKESAFHLCPSCKHLSEKKLNELRVGA